MISFCLQTHKRFQIPFFSPRFGKTFAVSMFAAAMLYATPSLELSIYSTCKRISQKLMRNVARFLDLIYKDTKEQEMPILRSNMEEVVLQGPEGVHDVRTVNSYPSKVSSSPRNTHPTLPQLSPNSPIHHYTATWSAPKWPTSTVLTRAIVIRRLASSNCWIRYASASTCSASKAAASQRRSLRRSCEISLTRRRKEATGIAGTVSEMSGRLRLEPRREGAGLSPALASSPFSLSLLGGGTEGADCTIQGMKAARAHRFRSATVSDRASF